MMNELIGNGIVLLALGGAVGLALRSIWRSRQAGGRCTGDCASCGGCHGRGK